MPPADYSKPRAIWSGLIGRELSRRPERRCGNPFAFPRLSPNERRLVVTLEGIQSSVWIYDFAAKPLNRLTFDGNNDWPLWTPDGKRVTYASNRSEPWQISGDSPMEVGKRKGY